MGQPISQLLREGARALGVTLDDVAVQKLVRYIELLLKWGNHINLTGHHTDERIANHLILDSLVPAPFFRERATVLDVGSGAGIPGLPLVVARPDLTVSLVEPRQKRAVFLRAAAAALEIRVEIHETRAETLASRYDIAVSRAFMPPLQWVNFAKGVVRPGGTIGIWAKKPTVPDAQTISYQLPNGHKGVVELLHVKQVTPSVSPR